MLTFDKIHDISVQLGAREVTYPGDTPFSREEILCLGRGDFCTLSKMIMSAHSGTHVDTPAHFMSDGSGLDGYAPNDFIRRAHVVNCGDREEVGLEALQGPGGFSELTVERGDAVLFKTANSVRDLCVAGEFTEDFTHLSGDAAALCVRMGVGLVGLDYITIDPYESEDYPAHTTLMKGGVLILEGIRLKEVPAGTYTLICLPLSISGAEGSPVRAVLLQ